MGCFANLDYFSLSRQSSLFSSHLFTPLSFQQVWQTIDLLFMFNTDFYPVAGHGWTLQAVTWWTGLGDSSSVLPALTYFYSRGCLFSCLDISVLSINFWKWTTGKNDSTVINNVKHSFHKPKTLVAEMEVIRHALCWGILSFKWINFTFNYEENTHSKNISLFLKRYYLRLL